MTPCFYSLPWFSDEGRVRCVDKPDYPGSRWSWSLVPIVWFESRLSLISVPQTKAWTTWPKTSSPIWTTARCAPPSSSARSGSVSSATVCSGRNLSRRRCAQTRSGGGWQIGEAGKCDIHRLFVQCRSPNGANIITK